MCLSVPAKKALEACGAPTAPRQTVGCVLAAASPGRTRWADICDEEDEVVGSSMSSCESKESAVAAAAAAAAAAAVAAAAAFPRAASPAQLPPQLEWADMVDLDEPAASPPPMPIAHQSAKAVLKNLPSRWHETDLLALICGLGFGGLYCHVEMPMRQDGKRNRKCCRGFAFVQFRDAQACLDFVEATSGLDPRHFSNSTGDRTISAEVFQQ